MRHLDGLPPDAQARLDAVRTRRTLSPLTEEEGTASLLEALALDSRDRGTAALRERDLERRS
jgi:hypothetical protein